MMMIKRFQPKATPEQWYALRQELAIKSWADRQRPFTDEEKEWLKQHPPIGDISVCHMSSLDDSAAFATFENPDEECTAAHD